MDIDLNSFKLGISHDTAANNFYLLDKDGLITKKRNLLALGQERFARNDMEEGMPLVEVIKRVKPHILLGLSGAGRLFTRPVIKTFH